MELLGKHKSEKVATALKEVDSGLIESAQVRRSSPETSRSHFNRAAEGRVQSSVVLFWTPANQLTWFNTESLHTEASVAQRSPNLFCIDRFSHMQRAREREEAEAGRVCWMVVGKSGSQEKTEGLFYFYSLTLLKFKGLERKSWRASEAERHWVRESSPVSFHLAFGIESEPAHYSVYHNTAGE